MPYFLQYVAEFFPYNLSLVVNFVFPGQVMAIEHKELPFAAVQFHPESILTDPKIGLKILANCLRNLRYAEE